MIKGLELDICIIYEALLLAAPSFPEVQGLGMI